MSDLCVLRTQQQRRSGWCRIAPAAKERAEEVAKGEDEEEVKLGRRAEYGYGEHKCGMTKLTPEQGGCDNSIHEHALTTENGKLVTQL
jgi:hypothetical protein